MTLDVLESSVRAALHAKDPVEAILEAARRFRDAGGARADAYNLLMRLRADANESDETSLLDAADFVVGYCSPQRAIWKESTDPPV